MPAEYNLEAPPKEVGETIPADCVHAVSVTLPTWDSNVAYEEGKEWVLSKLKTGYPRYLPLR
jgi:cystathionine gamma-synthase